MISNKESNDTVTKEPMSKLNIVLDGIVSRIKAKNSGNKDNSTSITQMKTNTQSNKNKYWIIAYKLFMSPTDKGKIRIQPGIYAKNARSALFALKKTIAKAIEENYGSTSIWNIEAIYIIPDKGDGNTVMTPFLKSEYKLKYDGLIALKCQISEMAQAYKNAVDNNTPLFPNDRFIFDNLPEDISTVLQLGVYIKERLEKENIKPKMESNTFSVAL